MSNFDLSNKVISSNFQRLLQISESSAVADGTGSAFALRLSGSSNVGINHDPVDGYSLFVDGAVSASTLALNDSTLFLGSVTMSQNNDGGVTFQDSSSTELGAFAGPGYFVLSSSFEEHGSSRPLFSMTQQVGSSQNENVMQVTSTFMKMYTSLTAGSEFSFGAYPSGSANEGDFFINDNFTVLPNKQGTGIIAQPLLFISKSRNVGLGHFGTIPNRLTTSGSIYAEGAQGHITASGNLLVEGDATIKGHLTFGDSSTDSVSFGAEVSSSIIPDANISYDLGRSDKVWKTLYAKDIIGTDGLIQFSGSLYSSGSQYNLGRENTPWGNLFVETIGVDGPVQQINVDDLVLEDSTIRHKNNNQSILIAPVGGTVVGIGTSTPSAAAKLTVDGNISASGTISADKFISSGDDDVILFEDDLSVTGNIVSTGSLTALGNTIFGNNSVVDSHTFTGNITADSDISASGDLSIANITASGDIQLDEDQRIYFEADKQTWIESNGANLVRIVTNNNQMLLLDHETGNRAVFGNETKVFIGDNNNALPDKELVVHGDISSSGDMIMSSITASGDVKFNNLPVSQSGLTSGILYTMSGSQLPLSGSVAEIAKFSNQKFVLIS